VGGKGGRTSTNIKGSGATHWTQEEEKGLKEGGRGEEFHGPSKLGVQRARQRYENAGMTRGGGEAWARGGKKTWPRCVENNSQTEKKMQGRGERGGEKYHRENRGVEATGGEVGVKWLLVVW